MVSCNLCRGMHHDLCMQGNGDHRDQWDTRDQWVVGVINLLNRAPLPVGLLSAGEQGRDRVGLMYPCPVILAV